MLCSLLFLLWFLLLLLLVLLWPTETSQIACQCTAHTHMQRDTCTHVCVLQLRQLFKLLLAEAVAFIVVVPTNSYSKGRFKAGFVASVASPLHKPALLYIFFSSLLKQPTQSQSQSQSDQLRMNERANERKKRSFFSFAFISERHANVSHVWSK